MVSSGQLSGERRFSKVARWLAFACASGLVGYAFPRLLIALGLPVADWILTLAAWIKLTPDWLSSDTALWATTVALALILMGIEVWWSPVSSVWASIAGSLGHRKRISLNEAAMRAYSKQRDSTAAVFAEHPMGENQADPINWFAVALIGRSDKKGEMPLYGVLPPSTWLRQIPEDDIRAGSIENNGSSLRVRGHPERVYESLHILKSDFRSRLDEIKDWG